MKGKYRVIVQNKRIRYDFEIRRNLTIIKGDSATGKTVLIDLIREYYQNGLDSGVELSCEKECIVLEGRNWQILLGTIRDSIVFIDEGNDFVSSKEFAAAIQKSDNYYVIVTRESLPTLPYSIEEIYGIRDSGKYGTLKRTYNEFYHLYGRQEFGNTVVPEVVLTEDSNSGFQFFHNLCDKKEIECISANGKSNIFSMLLKQHTENVLIIADGAAFGAEMERLMYLIKQKKGIGMYLPESFEWMILNAGVMDDKEVRAVLENPQDYIESGEYFSWEQFFTHLLIEKTAGTYLKYSKRSLNPVYLHENISERIIEKK